jgi:hypothetical protein
MSLRISNHTSVPAAPLVTPHREEMESTRRNPQPLSAVGSGRSSGSNPGPVSWTPTLTDRSSTETVSCISSPGSRFACRTALLTSSLVRRDAESSICGGRRPAATSRRNLRAASDDCGCGGRLRDRMATLAPLTHARCGTDGPFPDRIPVAMRCRNVRPSAGSEITSDDRSIGWRGQGTPYQRSSSVANRLLTKESGAQSPATSPVGHTKGTPSIIKGRGGQHRACPGFAETQLVSGVPAGCPDSPKLPAHAPIERADSGVRPSDR